MKMKRKIFCFNMVEIALALAIVGIGIAGIMALFPVALNASRDSIGDNNAPDVAEQFINYLESEGRKDWSAFNALVPSISTIAADDTGVTSYNLISGNNIYSTNSAGYWKVEIKSNNNVDFSAIVKVGKRLDGSNNSIQDLSVNKILTSVPVAYAVSLVVEISWPSEIPYDKRQKRYYQYEIFKYE